MSAVDLEAFANLTVRDLLMNLASKEAPMHEATRGVYKRGKRWLAHFSCNGKRYAKTFPTKQEAVGYRDSVVTGRGRLTVSALLAKYVTRSKRLRSAELYRMLAQRIDAVLGAVPAGDVRQEHVEQYLDSRLADGVVHKTAWNELSMLRSALNYAWRNDWVKDRPKFKLAKPKCSRKRILSREEISRLWLAADRDMRCVVMACLSKGLRRNEIIEANWSWVDRATRVMTIPAGVSKNAESHSFRIPEKLWDMLHQDESVYPVFTRGMERWSRSSLHRAFVDLARRSGMDGLLLHDLRRTMASESSRHVSIQVVQANGRWLDKAALQDHYLHARSEEVDALAESLADMVAAG